MNMSRREFMKYAGGGIAVMSGIPLLTNCAGTLRRDTAEEIDSASLASPLSEDEKKILYLATLAPSGHNAQPWTVRVNGPGSWTIVSDNRRWLPIVDPANRELMLSLGAFLENLRIAAGIYGYDARIRITALKSMDRDIAQVTLSRGKKTDFPEEAIRMRRTLRKNMQKKEIKSADLRYITGSDSDRCLFLPPGSREARYLSEGMIEANRVQAWRDPAQEELADWIRFSIDDAKKHCNGLTPESMEIDGVARWFVRNFFNRKSVLDQDFRKKTVEGVIEQVNSSGGWIIITSRDATPGVLLETGMSFQRMFLRVRDRMVAMHPMMQMLEEEPWRSSVAKELGVNETVQFIIRVGYVERYPLPVSIRMPLKSVIIG